MILLSITTATMLALVVEQRSRMMGKASVALVVRKGFVNRFGRPFGPARSFLIFRPPAGSPDGNFSCLRGFSSPLSVSLSACPIDASDKAGGKWCLMVPVDCAAVAWNRAGASTVGDKTGRRGMARTMTAGLCSRRLADRFFSRSTSRLLMHPQKRAITWLRRRPGFPLQL
jgi:hypothetical protein